MGSISAIFHESMILNDHLICSFWQDKHTDQFRKTEKKEQLKIKNKNKKQIIQTWHALAGEFQLYIKLWSHSVKCFEWHMRWLVISIGCLMWKQTTSTFLYSIIDGADVTKTARSLSLFLRVATASNTGQNVTSLIYLVCNGDMKACSSMFKWVKCTIKDNK